MSLLPGLILLQAQAPGPDWSFPIMLGAIVFIFYFLLIRPQQKRQKDHETKLKSIEKGDQVVTTGGIHGKVTGVSDDLLTVEIAALKGERVRVKVSRERIDTVKKAKGDDS